jgi:AcrR family transcriptional regulator
VSDLTNFPTPLSEPGGASPGRPAATSPVEIERVAFDLFAERGFEATTLDANAEQLGVARRTVARYYRSKNDIAWGRFDATLTHFASLLDAMPTAYLCTRPSIAAWSDSTTSPLMRGHRTSTVCG